MRASSQAMRRRVPYFFCGRHVVIMTAGQAPERGEVCEDIKKNVEAVVALLVICALAAFAAGRRRCRSRLELFKKQQDIQLGREYAQQVERQMYVVPNKELNDYVTRVGMRLVRQGGWRITHTISSGPGRQHQRVRAAGGPTYVHTGLLKAAENEAQLAGVLAHELSHVVLRHGTHQASRAVALQAPAMVLGGLVGRKRIVGATGADGHRAGREFGTDRVFPQHGKRADLLGAYTMAKAGYNPLNWRGFSRSWSPSAAPTGWCRISLRPPQPRPPHSGTGGATAYMPRGPYNAEEGDLLTFNRS